MIPEDTLALLERVLREGVGKVGIEYVSQSPGHCWFCTIGVYRRGELDLDANGTGPTLIEAIDDALTDLAESA